MKTDEVRRRFLAFFKAKDHRIIASDSLVPKNDPSVLFTSAGMNQFKEQFLGKTTDFRRATTSQKCLRTGDLEKVGHTPSHHTFFEMLGNFSFGDYFKKEAIGWAWEFLTVELKINPEKLRVSVYRDDDEAFRIWRDEIKVPLKMICQFGPKENFWPSNAIEDGPNGPCGPCSEIFFDWGADVGCGKPDCSPACDCGRFVEIWNLVFTQFNRKEGGALEPLPSRNIDTGMGLERIASCLQGVKTNFEIDIFTPIIRQIRDIVGIKAPANTQKVNCIADHIRACVFAIGDGVLPSNEGRGYVIRKLIRRASWLAQELGFAKPFLFGLAAAVCAVMKEPYPELLDRRENIASVIRSEEERFMNNIKEGSHYLDEIISGLKEKNILTISGQIIFKLYDTYGFPLELTEILAQQNGLSLDLVGFNKEMSQQRERARMGSAISSDIFSKDILEILPTNFVGYETTRNQANIIQLFEAKYNIDSLHEGQEGWLILDTTPFYGESGGQVGDTGEIIAVDERSKAQVIDTKQIDGSIVHVVEMIKGTLRVGDRVIAEIDSERRQAIRRAHTATHLLQAALRKVLGQHVQQAGSLVEPDYFRFDFTHFKEMKDEELATVQDLINGYVRAHDAVNVEIMEKDKALKSGAIALFGEKYGEKVRVISIADYSKEFCGGTHLDCTADIAVVLLDCESSIGSGLRRIQGYTGKLAYQKLNDGVAQLKDLAHLLQSEREAVVQEVESLIEKKKKLEKELTAITKKNIAHQIPEIMKAAKIAAGDGAGYVYQAGNIDIGLLRTISDLILERSEKKAIMFLASESGVCVVRISKDLQSTIDASKILRESIEPFEGSGGGRKDFAQGGIKDTKKLPAAMKQARDIIKKALQS